METMATDRIGSPEFAVVVRGYDRGQVDEYLGELLAWLSEAERRIQATDEANDSLRREVVQLRAAAASLEERAGVPGPQSLSAFSEKMGQVMQSAVEAANELRAEAEREANERRDAVAAEVERMVERAKAEAREILRRARAKERDLEASLTDLTARRAASMEELGRLHRQLAELLGTPEPASSTAATPGPPAREPASPPAGDHRGPAAHAAGSRDAADNEPKKSDGPYDAADTGDMTRTMPAVSPGRATPAPTMVRYPETGGTSADEGGRRNPSR